MKRNHMHESVQITVTYRYSIFFVGGFASSIVKYIIYYDTENYYLLIFN